MPNLAKAIKDNGGFEQLRGTDKNVDIVVDDENKIKIIADGPAKE